MLYELVNFSDQIGALNVFRYITFRTGGAIMTALLFVFLFGPVIIDTLRLKQGKGQPIREDGPKSHFSKKGTPTMGGLMILSGVLVSTLLWANWSNPYVWIVLCVTLCYGAIGFYDDYLKVTKRSTTGFGGRARLGLEIIVAAIAAYLIMRLSTPQFAGKLAIPFFKNLLLDLGPLFVVLGVLVITGAGNSVNLTDGLDGLAIVPVMIAAAAFGVFAYTTGNINIARYLQIHYVPGTGELALLADLGEGAFALTFFEPELATAERTSGNSKPARSIALTNNSSNRFECRWVTLRAEACAAPYLMPGELMPVPIAHGEGNYFIDAEGLKRLEGEGQVAFRYVDAKGEANRLFTEAGVPTTFLHTSFYWDNLIHFGMGPKKGADGALLFTLPMGDRKLPGIAAEDIGRAAYGIFKGGREYVGRSVGIAGAHLTGAEMAAALTRALGREVRYDEVTPEAYRGFGFPGADDLGNMFQFKRDFEDYYCGARSLAFSREVNPDLHLERIDDREPLVESGIMDSLGVLKIMAFLDEAFGVDLSSGEIKLENFKDVQTICDLVEKERGA